MRKVVVLKILGNRVIMTNVVEIIDCRQDEMKIDIERAFEVPMMH